MKTNLISQIILNSGKGQLEMNLCSIYIHKSILTRDCGVTRSASARLFGSKGFDSSRLIKHAGLSTAYL